MVSIRCKMIVKEELKKQGLHYVVVELGEVEIMETLSPTQRENLKTALLEYGFELMDDKKAILVEKIKTAIVEMVHYADELPIVKYSEYLSNKLNTKYAVLSALFSEVKGINIETYIIAHKIEKAKELLIYDELNLTEISYKLNYSSVAHLSYQFKKVTGLTPTDFKKIGQSRRKPLEDL